MDVVRTQHGRLALDGDGRVQVLSARGVPARAGDGLAADLVNAITGGPADDVPAPSAGAGPVAPTPPDQARAAALRASPGHVEITRPGQNATGPSAAGPAPSAGPAPQSADRPRPLTGADESDFGVDMTNWSVAVGHSVVKVIHAWGSADRAGVILDHLASIGSGVTPALLGRLDWVHPRGRATVAMVTELIPGATDGWTWAVDDVLAHLDGGPEPTWPRQLGALAARLHTDLARMGQGPPAHGGRVRAGAHDALTEALAVTGGDAGRRLRDRRGVLEQVLDTIPDDLTAPTIHVHGDLHVGQVLRANERYWVIDFDGDPQQPAAHQHHRDLAARDVAHLLTSVELVASVCARRRDGAEQTLRTWAGAGRAQVLAAYRAELATRQSCGLLDAAALEGLIVAQLLRELTYAATYLPRWQYAADTALTFRYGG